ncbi:hypothetical protein [Halobacteriovorax sp. HLS]|uniref:hypothetical protein n=1 Tax=Halobacteriovorax sp. HLS TaxID=2234000 RepID=UPI000FDBA2BB|nr:hypothetical protein [Halobacteriovorax sp. HLS]
MIKLFFVGLLSLYSINSYSLVGVGGYVPFGMSTQSESDGSRRTFSFEPYVYANTILSAPYNHLFLPEVGLVIHTAEKFDDYSKSTIFLLLDVGYKFTPALILRYGLGLFRTSISSDGGAVILNNGSGTSTFYKASDSSTSYNTTWNLGLEHSFNSNYSLKFQTYLFEPISSQRDISYSLSISYYR